MYLRYYYTVFFSLKLESFDPFFGMMICSACSHFSYSSSVVFWRSFNDYNLKFEAPAEGRAGVGAHNVRVYFCGFTRVIKTCDCLQYGQTQSFC